MRTRRHHPNPQNASDGNHQPDAESVQAGYEKQDISIRAVVLFGVGLVVALALVFSGLLLVFRVFQGADKKLAVGRERREPAVASEVRMRPDYQGPLLQVVPETDLRGMHGNNEADLDHYGWVDQPKGVVRLPIARAMDLVAERGLPSVSPGLTLEQIQQQRADPQVYGQVLRP